MTRNNGLGRTIGAIAATFTMAAAANAATFIVEQEVNAGAGDFQALGFINSYDASDLTALEAYQFHAPDKWSYNGQVNGLPEAQSGVANMFLVDTADGLAFFLTLDKAKDGSGGAADSFWTVAGDPNGAGLLVRDDDPGNDSYSAGTNQFSIDHQWLNCCTDGYVIGNLDGNFTLTGGFDTFHGLSQWIVKGNGTDEILALQAGRRARIRALGSDVGNVPLPAALPLAAMGFAGLTGMNARRRRKA